MSNTREWYTVFAVKGLPRVDYSGFDYDTAGKEFARSVDRLIWRAQIRLAIASILFCVFMLRILTV